MDIKPGIELVEEVEGRGAEANKGDYVEVKLNAWLNRGDQIQSNIVENIKLGGRKMIPGIEYAIEGMRSGGIRKVKISPHLGYGQEGVEGLVPPDALLIYEIELLSVG